MTQCALIGSPPSPAHDGSDAKFSSPASVHVIRVLGHGRAAQAQLVDATMPDGAVVRCVEKVFAPGRLTRLLYRLSFQSPFAYQSNEDAIHACFYRRRVAMAIVAASDLDVDVALPLYVRFDQALNAWVLAAQWIDGRGITPAPADPNRFGRLFRTVTTRGQASSCPPLSEVDELVQQMSQLEQRLIAAGLTGSGWQVAPRALVSTANLLRQGDRYTIIDLESGIPAVLVPKYLLGGLIRGTLPPFDDLDATKLRSWLDANERLLVFRMGPAAVDRLKQDVSQLIRHDAAWKAGEVAVFRRPWRWLTRSGFNAYRTECVRRWRQAENIDHATVTTLRQRPLLACMIWCAGLLPGRIGRLVCRWLGRASTRKKVSRFMGNAAVRRRYLRMYRIAAVDRWKQTGRIAEATNTSGARFILHRLLQLVPTKLHRLLVDAQRRREVATKLLLLMFSARFQADLGRRRIESAIERWRQDQRITDQQASALRSDLSGDEVRVYTRGFGMHLALKALAPIVIPAKVGGIAAFAASGNGWFLIPLLLTPVMRMLVTLASMWSSRRSRVPHGEALWTCMLPTIGSIAFPFQMFAQRPELSTFLIRDAASRVGCKLPVYGGADSRTEMAAIRATDFLIEAMRMASLFTKRLRRLDQSNVVKIVTESTAILPLPNSRFGRWLEQQTTEYMASIETTSEATKPEDPAVTPPVIVSAA